MAADDLFSAADARTQARSNVPEMSVSELAFSLKRTLEETYGRVRVRGELVGIKIAASGHLYGDIKDEDSVINIVCWRGSMSRLSIRPEDGLDVIVTGKMTSYPKNSRYQLVIESMELAGEGAILKMLEERKKKLAAEGLFDPAKKRPLPFLPQKIGVITSPTGAVIRDIIHRITDRFPRHLYVWPVLVQGPGAADQVAAAVKGFNALPPSHKPDVLIVARGGGSLEDLMAFNEEAVVRAVAASAIPVISAVGHETDTTLCDFAADLRAPTPTAAAEMAVPVRMELLAAVRDGAGRLSRGMQRKYLDGRNRLETLSAKLGDPSRLLDTKTQHLDHISSKLGHAFDRGVSRKAQRLAGLSPRHPRSLIDEKARHLTMVESRLNRASERLLTDPEKRLAYTGRMLQSLSFESVLERGFAVVRGADGTVISDAEQAANQEAFDIQFRRNGRVSVRKS